MSLLSSIFSTASTQSTSLFTNSKAASTPTEPAKTDASFGPSYLLDISSEANNAAASASTTSDSDKDKESQDALLALIQQLLTLKIQKWLQPIPAIAPIVQPPHSLAFPAPLVMPRWNISWVK